MRHLPATPLRMRAERLVILVGVVSAAPEREILDPGGTSARERDHVVKLQTAGLGTPAACPNERTSPSVPRPDEASHRRGDVS